MSITAVGSGADATRTTAGTLSVPLPVGYLTGDVGLLLLNQRDSSTAITTPTGWTLIKRQGGNSATHFGHLYYRVLDAADGSTVAVTNPASTKLQGVISVYRGVDTGTVQDRAFASGEFHATLPIAGSAAHGFPATPGGDNVTTNAAVVSFVASQGARRVFMDPYGIYENVIAGNDYTIPNVSYGDTDYYNSTDALAVASAWIIEPTPSMTPTIYFDEAVGSSADCVWITIHLRPESSVPDADTTFAAMTQLPADRSIGVVLSPKDVWQTKFSVQILTPYSDNVGRWDVAHWDVNNWAPSYQWNDLSPRVRGVTWTRGAEQPGGRPAVGTATVTIDNLDGEASAWSTAAGDFTEGGVSWLRAGILVRFGANQIDPVTHEEFYQPFFTGLIETMPESTSENVDAWVDFNLVETLSTLAVYESPAQSVAGAGEDIEDRLNRLTADADWQYGIDLVSIFAGWNNLFQGTTLAGNRLAEVQLTGDSEGLALFSGPDGRLAATAHGVTGWDGYGTVYSNDPAGDELPMVSAKPYVSTDRIINTVSGQRVGGAVQTQSSQASIDKYGVIASNEFWPRTDLICTTDAGVLNIVNGVVVLNALDDIGIESIELDADMVAGTDSLFNTMFDIAAYGIGGFDGYTFGIGVRWVHPSGSVLDNTFVVEGFTFNLTMEGDQAKWTGTINTDLATPPYPL